MEIFAFSLLLIDLNIHRILLERVNLLHKFEPLVTLGQISHLLT